MRADLIRTIVVSALLLLLGAATPVAAVPISGSARLDAPAGSWPAATGTFTVGPDQYAVGFGPEPITSNVGYCFSNDGSFPEGCPAGAFMGAFATEAFGDVYGSLIRGGQEILRGCDSNGRARYDEPHGRCVSFWVEFGWGTVQPLPPLPSAGNTEAVVASTFGVLLVAGILQDGNPTADFVNFRASGPGRITVAPGQDEWVFRSAEGWIDPVPEPATFLLFGTTAAWLGAARWWKRRRQHAP